MSRSRSAQVHVVVAVSPTGKTWVVGTGSQKGFTEAAAERAKEKIEEKTHGGWSILTMEITPIDEVLPRAAPVPAP